MQPPSTDFDKLRKRVSYLTKQRKKIQKTDYVPSNLQIHEKFINDDNEMRMMRKLDRGEVPKMDDSDSDESIVALKE